MIRRTRSPGQVAAVVTLLAVAAPLHADELTQNPKVAEALFREGRALLERGEIDAACEKLAQSQKLDPSGGTLMNLADCHEKQGRTATAWAEFLAAEERSNAERRTARAAEAKRRAAALEPILSRLTILVPQPVPGLEVRRDDQLVPSDQLGVAVPVDPGFHRVTATAPGYAPAALDVTLGASADGQTVTLPELRPPASAAAPEPSAPPAAPAPTAAASENIAVAPWNAPERSIAVIPPAADESGRTTIGWVAGGSGLVLAGAGGVFYLMSLSANENAERGCTVQSRYRCSDAAMQAGEKRDTYATLATIGGVAGIAGIGVGAWLLLTSHPGETSATQPATSRAPKLVPAVAPRQGSLILHGVFQ